MLTGTECHLLKEGRLVKEKKKISNVIQIHLFCTVAAPSFCIELCKLKQFKLFNTIIKAADTAAAAFVENFIGLAQVVQKMNGVIHRISTSETN